MQRLERVSLIVVDLPVDEEDPVSRLELVHARTTELKGSGLVDGADAIVRIADGISPILSAPLTRLVSRRIPMNLVITNIPGPPVPLYWGRMWARRFNQLDEITPDMVQQQILGVVKEVFRS